MKLIIFLITITTLSGCSSSRENIPEGAQKIESSWESGSLKQRYYTSTSADSAAAKVGPYIEWFESGALKTKGQYKNGLKHGFWHYYNDKGYKEKKVLFDLGEPKRTIIPSPTDRFDHHWHHHCQPHYPHHRLHH